jgi:hypothetical protein
LNLIVLFPVNLMTFPSWVVYLIARALAAAD